MKPEILCAPLMAAALTLPVMAHGVPQPSVQQATKVGKAQSLWLNVRTQDICYFMDFETNGMSVVDIQKECLVSNKWSEITRVCGFPRNIDKQLECVDRIKDLKNEKRISNEKIK